MKWVRGELIGKGSFGSVYVATPRKDSPLMAVKSVKHSHSSLLHKEKEILTQFLECPQILHCFGEDYTVENGEGFYNLLLEFASRGNLHQLMRDSGGAFSEIDVRYYAKSILHGLKKIHEKDYVHCDIKLQNILLCEGCPEVKIADFGLAKKTGEMKNSEDGGLRGTPLYMSPESVSGNDQEAPSDIWALGCIVAEMFTGSPAWKCKPDADVSSLLFRIGFTDELPEIPKNLSEEGKDFLRKCFIRDPAKRWSAGMLLNHSFVCVDTVTLPGCDQPSPSPRSPFDFPDWSSNQVSSSQSYQWNCSTKATPIADRMKKLGFGIGMRPNWSLTESWVIVRDTETPVSET